MLFSPTDGFRKITAPLGTVPSVLGQRLFTFLVELRVLFRTSLGFSSLNLKPQGLHDNLRTDSSHHEGQVTLLRDSTAKRRSP